MAKIMVVDDQATVVQMVTEHFRDEGHDLYPFTHAETALERMETIAPELVITDLYLEKSRPSGLDILNKARTLDPPALVMVVTAYGSVETAVEAMKHGAHDYVEKPLHMGDLKMRVKRALTFNETLSENLFLRRQLKIQYQPNRLIGNSPQMQEVLRLIERVADCDATILILGESGTGKELVARALHFNSRRQMAPFVPINCSALPEHLLESELFGHRKGAFTGAINDKKGLFQEAHSGTIFLDEVASMSPPLQSRLLRVLQEREVRRVGDNFALPVDVRVLAATNEPLERRLKEGAFREDLYYRLNVISIALPPLRERREDVPLLVAHFLKNRINVDTGKPFRITRQAMAALETHDWPGNVRELENAIERGCTLCDGDSVQLTDLPPVLHHYAELFANATEVDARINPAGSTPGTPAGSSRPAAASDSTSAASPLGAVDSPAAVEPLKNFLRAQELNHINRALSTTGGDKDKAAHLLGISLATLYRKLMEEDPA